MSRFAGRKPISRKAFDHALNRIEKEAQQAGRTLREQLLFSAGEHWKAQHSMSDTAALPFQNLPIEFLRELVNFGAGRSKRTPASKSRRFFAPGRRMKIPNSFKTGMAKSMGNLLKARFPKSCAKCLFSV